MEQPASYRGWIGKFEEVHDHTVRAPLDGLAALLDHTVPPWRQGEVPPLGHWLFFLPRAPHSAIGRDGHPGRGDFLPPIALPRRMWAGSRIRFHAPVPLGAPIRRRSTIFAVEEKAGKSGPLVFVTVSHEVSSGDRRLLTEHQDIVYCSLPGAAAPSAGEPGPEPASPAWSRTISPDPVLLFRYSALIFNSHRIHFDRDYARDVEGYPGLVVQGPLTATLLMDLFLRQRPAAPIAAFAFRGVAPLFDTEPFTLVGTPTPDGARLAACNAAGSLAMAAKVTLRS